MTRIPQLDGVRGIAILLVLALHYVCRPLDHATGPARLLRLGLEYTWSGVDLFFVLSGFLICGILLDNRAASNYFSVFYIRRSLRILPIYLLCVLSYVLVKDAIPVEAMFTDGIPTWSYWLFAQNYFMGSVGHFGGVWLGGTWSLAIEEQFYLALPLVIWVVPRRALLPVFLGGILLSMALRREAGDLQAYAWTHMRLDGLLSGAVLAVLIRQARVRALLQDHGRWLVTLLAVMTALTVTGAVDPIVKRSPFDHHTWFTGLYTTLVLVAVLDAAPRLTAVLRSSVLVWFGTLSYGLYLIHQPMNHMLHWLILNKTDVSITTTVHVAITGLALAATLALGWLSFQYFESPLLKLGRATPYQRGIGLGWRLVQQHGHQ